MVKHFEKLWEESEQLASATIESVDSALHQLQIGLTQLSTATSNEEKTLAIGLVLYTVSFISQTYNVNVYEALVYQMQNQQIDLLDADQTG